MPYVKLSEISVDLEAGAFVILCEVFNRKVCIFCIPYIKDKH